MDHSCDADLVRRARGGDADAFRVLVERYLNLLPASDDVRQEALLQAWLSLPRLRDDTRFGGWLHGIVRNVTRAERRRAGVLVFGWDDDGPAGDWGDLELRWVVREAVAGLPDGARAAIWLYYYEDLSVEQVARELAVSRSAVKTRLYDGRRLLREQLAAALPDLPEKERLMIELHVAELRSVPGRFLAVLAGAPGQRVLPLWLEPREAAGLFGPGDLAEAVLEATGGELRDIRLAPLPEGLYGAVLTIRTAAGERTVNAQLGAALQLAHRRHRPVLVPPDLLDARGVRAGSVAEAAEAAITAAGIPLAATRQTGERVAEPRNLDFADGLRYWDLRGSFLHRRGHLGDYTCDAQAGTARLAAAVAAPAGFADLRQGILADDFRGGRVSCTAEALAEGAAGLYLRVIDPDRSGHPEDRVLTLASGHWSSVEVCADVPDDSVYVLFGVTLTGPGHINVRNVRITPA